MSYEIDGRTIETDDEGYVLEAEAGEELCPHIAAIEGVELTDDHWVVIRYLRDRYREDGHTPNFRQMLKDLADLLPGCDNKRAYDLFPMGPAKQGAKIAALPRPLGKGGY